MWKIALGFIVFAAAAIFVILKGGDKLDMSGEKHGSEAVHAPEPVASTPAATASAAAPVPAPMASAPAPAPVAAEASAATPAKH